MVALQPWTLAGKNAYHEIETQKEVRTATCSIERHENFPLIESVMLPLKLHLGKDALWNMLRALTYSYHLVPLSKRRILMTCHLQRLKCRSMCYCGEIGKRPKAFQGSKPSKAWLSLVHAAKLVIPLADLFQTSYKPRSEAGRDGGFGGGRSAAPGGRTLRRMPTVQFGRRGRRGLRGRNFGSVVASLFVIGVLA